MRVSRMLAGLVATVVVAAGCVRDVSPTAQRDVERKLAEHAEEAAAQPYLRASQKCLLTVAHIGPSASLSGSADPVELISGDQIAGLPLPGHDRRQLSALHRYESAGDVAGFSRDFRAARVAAAVRRDGFRDGVSATFQTPQDLYYAKALRMASPEAAADLRNVFLKERCEEGGNVYRSPANTSVGLYESPATHVGIAMAAGDSLVVLSICSCVETDQPFPVLDNWAALVLRQLGGSPTAG